MALSLIEKETHIIFNEFEPTAWVQTFNPGMKRSLEKLAQERPDKCRLLKTYDEGEVRYEVPKKWVAKIRPERILSDAEKARMTENAARMNEQKRRNAS